MYSPLNLFGGSNVSMERSSSRMWHAISLSTRNCVALPRWSRSLSSFTALKNAGLANKAKLLLSKRIAPSSVPPDGSHYKTYAWRIKIILHLLLSCPGCIISRQEDERTSIITSLGSLTNLRIASLNNILLPSSVFVPSISISTVIVNYYSC